MGKTVISQLEGKISILIGISSNSSHKENLEGFNNQNNISRVSIKPSD